MPFDTSLFATSGKQSCFLRKTPVFCLGGRITVLYLRKLFAIKHLTLKIFPQYLLGKYDSFGSQYIWVFKLYFQHSLYSCVKKYNTNKIKWKSSRLFKEEEFLEFRQIFNKFLFQYTHISMHKKGNSINAKFRPEVKTNRSATCRVSRNLKRAESNRWSSINLITSHLLCIERPYRIL